MKKFPESFLWGGATSGPQSEGRFNKENDHVFDYWYDHSPEEFYNYVGPDTAANFYNSFRNDIALLKELKLNSLRTSIQWTRLIEDFEKGTINEDGVRFYNDLIDELIKNDIEPILTLHHFDLPVKLYEKYGGWASKKVGDLFVQYAANCYDLFGDRVRKWFVFNEPKIVAEGQYLHRYHYPKISDGKTYLQVTYNLVLATSKAIKAFRDKGFSKTHKIGTILNLTPSYAASNNKKDKESAHIAELLNNKVYLNPAILGEFPEDLVTLLEKDGVLWESTEEELELIQKNTIDILGVNFYHPERVKAPDIIPTRADDWYPSRYFNHYSMPGRTMNVDKGWEVYPEALYDISITIKNEYNNIPWFVSENGMGISREHRFLNNEGMVEDDYRIEFIQNHLEALHRGIEEGSNCFGYHLWTPIDNWSWKNAFKNRYGLISTNVHNQKKTIKKSGYWFRDVIENNGIR